MSKTRLLIRSLAVAAMVLSMAATAPSALAAAPASGAAPAARIVVFDLNRAFQASKVGQSIAQQVVDLRKQAEAQFKSEVATLQRERAQIEAETAVLNASVKAQKENAWKARAMALQKKVDERGNLIQGGVIKARAQVEEALGPILKGLMQERQATVMLDRGAVLIAPPGLDVTPTVVQRLDLKMPTVKVELAPLPPAYQQAAARQQAAQQ